MSLGKPEVLSSTKSCIEDRILELEVENSRLQRLVAELLLKNQQLRDAHLPNPSDSGKFDRNRSRPDAERSLLDSPPRTSSLGKQILSS
jgi:hypothetical protein